MSIVTFPAFLLSYFGNIDWPLIVIPRQISLIFTILCLLVLRKILKRFTLPEWGIAGALLMWILLPAIGYFSMRFSTVNAVMFFAMLSLYLAMRDDHPLDFGRLLRVFVSLAIAGAIKLTGLLIAPLVLFFIYKRLKCQYGDESLPFWVIKAVVIFFGIAILLAAPQLPYLFFHQALLSAWIKNLQYFIGVTKIPLGSPNVWLHFFESVLVTPGVAIVYGLLVSGLLIGGFRNSAFEKNLYNHEFRAILMTLIAVSVYLSFSIKSATSLGSYFTCILVLIFLGLVPLLKSPRSVWLLGFLIGVLMLDVTYRVILELDRKGVSQHHLSYFIKDMQSKERMKLAQQTMDCIEAHQSATSIKHFFLDYSTPSFISPLTFPGACVSYAWGNLSPQGKYCDLPIDFLVLDTKAIGYLPIDEFQEHLNGVNHSLRESHLRDRASRAQLESSGKFGNQNFKLACDLVEARIFHAQ
ncbi:hypothetical protein G6683_01780 [Polynucleobacter paneuropaeus]|nr:hypothetical protein [Polynucleobacter paneuropaeus]